MTDDPGLVLADWFRAQYERMTDDQRQRAHERLTRLQPRKTYTVAELLAQFPPSQTNDKAA